MLCCDWDLAKFEMYFHGVTEIWLQFELYYYGMTEIWLQFRLYYYVVTEIWLQFEFTTLLWLRFG